MLLPERLPDRKPLALVTASFPLAASQQSTYSIRLPITTPVQVPKIVSTGIAESPYRHTPDYSATSSRNRYLWIEFDQPIADSSDDPYFGRVLAYCPDPLLAASLLPQGTVSDMLPDAVEPPIPADHEPVRHIFSGQSADQAGLDAMPPLIPTQKTGVGKQGRSSCRCLPELIRKILPYLASGPTNSVRVTQQCGPLRRAVLAGHFESAGSNILRSICSAPCRGGAHLFQDLRVLVTAPYAVTVFNGNRLYNLENGDTQTTIWFMLCTQVLQTDGTSLRNILLDHRQCVTLPQSQDNPQHKPSIGPLAAALFEEPAVQNLLSRIGLPSTSLSVLAVEILPGPLHFEDQLGAGSFVTAETARSREAEDPLGRKLGGRRILRVSPLAAVPAIC